MAFAFVRRTVRGTGFHTPDKDHIHHRLLRLGHGPRRTVVILWAWTALLSGFVLFPLFQAGQRLHPASGVAALGMALYTLFHPGLRRQDPGELVPAATAGPPDGRPDGSRARARRAGPGRPEEDRDDQRHLGPAGQPGPTGPGCWPRPTRPPGPPPATRGASGRGPDARSWPPGPAGRRAPGDAPGHRPLGGKPAAGARAAGFAVDGGQMR